MTVSWKRVIKQANDLVTPHEKTRAGFIHLALEKNRQAEPFLEQARQLRALIKPLKKPYDIWKIKNIRPCLLAAAGISQKAIAHLTAKDCELIYNEFCQEFLAPAGNAFRDELTYRFLLTKGDALGGRMRNIGGKLGKRKFNRSIIAALELINIPFDVAPRMLPGYEEKIKTIHWIANKKNKVLAFDIKVRVTQTNVDLCLLATSAKTWRKASQDAGNYLALGELKGGFDPAGADEHWKTASHALARIRESFAASSNLFFVGAAVEKNMALEIFRQLKNKEPAFAANLTNEEQTAGLAQWMVSL